MSTVDTLRHVPWTCIWGRFGESAPSTWPTFSPHFVFWTCARPGARACVTRERCNSCPHWRATSSVGPLEDDDLVPSV